MGIETKVVVEIFCDYPGCQEIFKGPSQDYATYSGWDYTQLLDTLKKANWSLNHNSGSKIVLCERHTAIKKYIKEYVP